MEFNRNNDFVGRAGSKAISHTRSTLPFLRRLSPKQAVRLFASTSAIALSAALLPGPASAAGPCVSDTITLPGTNIVTCSGTISTSPDNDPAAPAQALGANGGGASSFNGAAFGGDGTDAPSAVSLFVVDPSTLTTTGQNSAGAAAESVGGHGGSGDSFNGPSGGGRGADGFDVTADGNATIVTTGNGSTGFKALSRGGNGGSASNFNNSATAGSGGDAGEVGVTYVGTISTQGQSAYGISAQSLAGAGGGVDNFNGSATAGNGGDADDVDVTFDGSISTQGTSAHGIFAQSRAGAAGGLSNFNGPSFGGTTGTAGSVSVDASGDITVSGADADGIRAESWGAVTGIVTVDVGGGAIQGGSGNGVGVFISTNSNATLTNAGTISALSGTGLRMTGDVVVIDNTGTIIGNVFATANTSAHFNNFAGSKFEPGDTVNLGAISALTNEGTVSPGGVGTLRTTAWTGGFIQGAGGILKVDADWANSTSDRIDVTGAATVAGTVVVNPISFPSPNVQGNEGRTKQWTILTATGGVANNGLDVTDTAAVDYTLLYPDANTVDLQASINFLGTAGLNTRGLTSNQTSVGKTLNKVVGGGGSFGFVPDILGLGTQGELKDALNQLTPAGDGAGFSSAMGTGQTFAGQLLSCRVAGEGDAHAVIREGQCVWARGTGRRLDNDGGESGVGFKEDAAFFSGGMQFDIGGNWRVGGGLGYESIGLSTDSRASSEGERAHVGGVIKYNPGPWLFAASVTGGYGWFDNKRVVSFGNFASVATSDYNDKFVTGQLTAAHQLNLGRDLYLKPQIMAGLTHLNRDGYTETASRDAGLDVHGSSDTVFSLSPSLELGGQVAMAHGLARPYLRAGLTWRSEDTFATTANFSAAPGAANSFTVTSSVDDVVADIGAGIDFIAPGNTALRFEYGGQFGEQTTQHSGSAKISVPF